jgi:hypothetical protein
MRNRSIQNLGLSRFLAASLMLQVNPALALQNFYDNIRNFMRTICNLL